MKRCSSASREGGAPSCSAASCGADCPARVAIHARIKPPALTPGRATTFRVMTPRVAAIVPATDRPPTLDRCLEAIRAAREPPDDVIAVTEPDGTGPGA